MGPPPLPLHGRHAGTGASQRETRTRQLSERVPAENLEWRVT